MLCSFKYILHGDEERKECTDINIRKEMFLRQLLRSIISNSKQAGKTHRPPEQLGFLY